MYSPQIAEDLIPVLYRTAKASHQPMTRLVDTLIRAGLAALPIPPQIGTAVVPTDAIATGFAQKGGS